MLKRIALVVLLAVCGLSFSVPAYARNSTSPKAQAREVRKTNKRQQKANKKYAKAQKKAQRKMLKTERKNSRRY